MTRRLHLGGFQIGGNTGLASPDHYHHVGRTLERGKFDFVFSADQLTTPARATATLDPSIVAASVGAVTSTLGVAITKSATFSHPYELARIFASLDHVTKGRVAWNIVTSLTQRAPQNIGDDHLGHEYRYERADEFVRAALEPWSSWDADGLHLRNRGPLNLPHAPQGRPVLMQAGSSNTGTDFAARWAEAIFEIDPTPEGRRAYYDDVKSRVVDAGRDPDGVLIFPAFIPFIGETESIAREKQAFHNELADPICGLITLSVHTEHDFSGYHLDAPVQDIAAGGTCGLFDTARRVTARDDLTLRDVGKLYAQGVLLPHFVGTATQVADQIEESFTAGEADGFMVSAAQSPGTFDDFVALVVPELQRRSLFRTEYAGSTLRDHLGLGAGAAGALQRQEVAVAS